MINHLAMKHSIKPEFCPIPRKSLKTSQSSSSLNHGEGSQSLESKFEEEDESGEIL
jgi:hypothetical protein